MTAQIGPLAQRMLARGVQTERVRAIWEAAARGELPEPAPDPDVRVVLAEVKAAARASALAGAIPDDGGFVAARAGLSALDDEQHPGLLREWLADPERRILILSGATGRGKSFAGYALLAEAATVGMACRTGSGVRVLPQVVRAWTQTAYLAALRPDGSPIPHWLVRDQAYAAGVFLLDDLGAEVSDVATEHARRELVDLLETRFRNGGRTVITTNLPHESIAAMFGDRLYSRVTDRGTLMAVRGDDRRLLHAEEWA